MILVDKVRYAAANAVGFNLFVWIVYYVELVNLNVINYYFHGLFLLSILRNCFFK